MMLLQKIASVLPLLIVGAVWTSVPVSAQTIHLITVADSKDRGIGSGATANTAQISDFINKAASEMKVTVSRQDISGNAFNCQTIRQAIALTKPGNNDVVIFYYSGHGFRSDGSTSKFPELFCGDEAFAGGAPRLVDVASQLAQKGARLTITVADACNVLFSQPIPPVMPAAIASVPVSRLKQYQNLFLRHRGTLTMSSSRSGQFSWYWPHTGMFTEQFVKALDGATQPGKQGLWGDVVSASLVEIKVPYGNATLPQNPESENNISLHP